MSLLLQLNSNVKEKEKKVAHPGTFNEENE